MKNPIIVVYALKDGFKDFVVFDQYVRGLKKDNSSWLSLSPKEMIEKLVEPEQMAMIDNYVRNCQDIRPEYRIKGIDYFATMPEKGGKQAKVLCDALQVGIRKKAAGFIIEKEILKTRIRGYVFDGYKNKKAVVVRDFGSIMPVGYSLDCGKTWENNEALKDEKTYKTLMLQSVFPVFEYGREYNNHIEFNHVSHNGYSRVSGTYGTNYMGARTHRHFFPFDVDEVYYPFTPTSQEFKLGKHKVFFDIEERCLFVDDHLDPWSYQHFCDYIKLEYPERPFYSDNILQDLIAPY